jgi:hypothetical protein
LVNAAETIQKGTISNFRFESYFRFEI